MQNEHQEELFQTASDVNENGEVRKNAVEQINDIEILNKIVHGSKRKYIVNVKKYHFDEMPGSMQLAYSEGLQYAWEERDVYIDVDLRDVARRRYYSLK
jgi:hypothetical protein